MSEYRRRLIEAAGNDQYIECTLNKIVESCYFILYLNGEKKQINSGVDFVIKNNGEISYFRYIIPNGKFVTSMVTSFSADKIISESLKTVFFSINFDFKYINSISYAFSGTSVEIIKGLNFSYIKDFSGAFRKIGSNYTLNELNFIGDTRNATSLNRIFHGVTSNLFYGNFSWLVIPKNCNTEYWNTSNNFIRNGYISKIGNISSSISFSFHNLTLNSVFVVLNALQNVENEEITFSSVTSGYIQESEEALNKIEEVSEIGWTVNLN